MLRVKYSINVAAAIAVLIVFLSIGAGFTLQATLAQEKNKPAKSGGRAVPGGTYNLDPAHSIVGFAVRHFEINWVSGRFKDLTGTINYNEQDATKSTVAFTAKIESADTGVAPRDAHRF